MNRIIRVLASLVAVLGSAAQADWVLDTRDDGALFYGGLVSNPPNMSIRCVGLSAGGRNLVEADAHETAQTPPYSVRIEITPTLIPFAPNALRRGDILFWLDGAGYQFPEVIWNDLDGVWTINVALADPLIAALQGASDFVMGPAAGQHYRIDVTGLGAALTQATAFCVSEYARLGHPVPGPLMPFAADGSQERGGDTMVDLAEAAISRSCNGSRQVEPGHILVGNIDGDASPDAVVDWRKITCSVGAPRPFCGASNCAADVYLSRKFPQTGQAEIMLAVGVSLIPLDNGTEGLQLGGSLSSCHSAGKGNACTSIWYWDGSDLVLLQ